MGLAILLVVLPFLLSVCRFEEEAGILWSSASGGGSIVRLYYVAAGCDMDKGKRWV